MGWYKTFEELHPFWDWHPAPVHHDPNPNPPSRMGIPVQRSSIGELYGWHKRNGTLECFYDQVGRER